MNNYQKKYYYENEGKINLYIKNRIKTDLYKKWLGFQFTPEMNWSDIEIDHVKPICMFDVSKDDELKEAFNWKNTQPLLKQDHLQKGIKFNFLDYQLQFINVY